MKNNFSKSIDLFATSFIRQMGREAARSTYKDLTNGNGKNMTATAAGIINNSFTPKFLFRDYLLIAVALYFSFLCPLFALIPFIYGYLRVKGKKVKGHEKKRVNYYTQDRRYRTGQRYCGSVQKWVSKDKARMECSESEISTARKFGIAEMAISGLVFIFTSVVWLIGITA